MDKQEQREIIGEIKKAGSWQTAAHWRWLQMHMRQRASWKMQERSF